jgi:hypothetical protein
VSQENVEVVRRFTQEFEAKRHELPSIIDRLWDAEADYYPQRKHPDAAPRHAHLRILSATVWYLCH